MHFAQFAAYNKDNGRKVENVTFYFLGLQNNCRHGDCRHDIKRCFLLGVKAMTNLARVLNSRDIALPTKVHRVKALVFPVVMYGCDGWTIKKAEHQRIDAFKLCCWRSKEIQSVHPKGK